MVCSLPARVFGTVLICGIAGQDGGDVEYYRGFLVRERVLGRGFMCEGVKPAIPALANWISPLSEKMSHHVNEILM